MDPRAGQLSTNAPVVAAIIEQEINGEKHILMQTRRKPGTEYHANLEIPGGWVLKWEHVFTALAREIKEECNLNLTHIHQPNYVSSSCTIGFSPFYCCQQLRKGLPWLVMGFVVQATGNITYQAEETREPHWVNIDTLPRILRDENVFDLYKPMLQYYLDHHQDVKFQAYRSND